MGGRYTSRHMYAFLQCDSRINPALEEEEEGKVNIIEDVYMCIVQLYLKNSFMIKILVNVF